MIETVTVEVATCDACGRQECANDQGDFSEGFSLTIVQYASNTRHDAFACKETHISKAARKVLEEWHFDGVAGEIVSTPGAPLTGSVIAHNDSGTPEAVVSVPGYADDDSDDHRDDSTDGAP